MANEQAQAAPAEEKTGSAGTEPAFQGIGPLLAMIRASEKHYDIEKLERAYLYAKNLHEGQYRVSGEPYISHPIAVAEIVASLGLDTDSICAAFLHDTVEDCPDKTSIDIIRNRFGDDVAMLVDGLTKMKAINVEDKEEANIENIRKMLLAMSKDIRVIFIKLCDRLHNMRTLGVKPENKRRATALETMHVYAPLAHRLGMQRIKQELENLALSYLDPIGYAEVSADGPAEGNVRSLPVTSVSKEMERGMVETGDERVNRLVRNAYWGMLSNYISIPTDCPQRTERLGWTGDTQVFCKTASYFADVRGFFRKWMQDVRDTQHADGTVPHVVPLGAFGDGGPIAGWSDAAIIVPWTMWKYLADESAVTSNWEAMERYMARIAKDGYVSKRGTWLLCDWLSFENLSVDQSKRWSNGSYTADHLFYQNFLNACHLLQDARMMAEMKKLGVGNKGLELDYGELAEQTKARILKTWFKEDGTLCDLFKGMQTPALFALKLGLGDRRQISAGLVSSIHANGDRLSTGFLGTPLLCEVLSDIGETELAYTILLQRKFPSWLYTVDQGATTMWERWNSYTKESGFGDVKMNSFNHYAYGAVVGWLFEHAAGIQPDPDAPGWAHFVLAPEPDAQLGRLTATYKTDFGTIESAWEYGDDGVCRWRFTVPAETTATVRLPDGKTFEAHPGTSSIELARH